jgi:hypothetical protein
MITQREFNEATARFKELEKRGSFYPMFCDMMDKGLEIEAYLFILSTWNFAVFRYAMKEFDINGFKKTMERLGPAFDKLKNESFRTIEFDKYKEEIVTIFETLSKIEGVKYTGATKIMHLKNRSLFVMWDGYISGNTTKRYYNELEIVKKGKRKFKRYKRSGEGYFQFLKDMRELFNGLNSPNDKKTFAKAIDEYNYVNITLRIQDMQREERKKKKEEKKKEKAGRSPL